MTGKIKLVHSGGNAVSIAVPTSNPSASEVEFKLPSSDGSANQVLKTDGSGNLSFASDQGGKILQVVQSTYTGVFSTSSATMVDTGLSVSITPTSSSSKILVTVSLGSFANSGKFKRAMMNIVRGSTNVLIGDARTGTECTAVVAPRASDDNYAQIPLAFTFLDSPNTTSATTYKAQASRGEDTGTVYLNGNAGADANSGNAASTIVVMEVAA